MSSKSYPKPKLWTPKNPKKYIGDPLNIWVRSSWELKAFKWMDENDNVLQWSSEELIIPYLSPVDNKWHNYYPDIMAKMKTKSGIVVFVLEIKPFCQTIEPVIKKRISKSYINEVCTWGVNTAKWKAAEKFCKERGFKFKILTERDVSF